GVPDAAAGAHTLGQARVDEAGVAERVLVLELARQHPGHDLHVLVRVGVEASAGRHDVVVTHEQQAVVGVGPVEVAPEAEAMVRVEPADFGGETGVRAADVNGGLDRRVHRYCLELYDRSEYSAAAPWS